MRLAPLASHAKAGGTLSAAGYMRFANRISAERHALSNPIHLRARHDIHAWSAERRRYFRAA